tara:strand:- start:1250 stop:1648 length:399 start_codon:yes stop_codon:yes gene_type:complete
MAEKKSVGRPLKKIDGDQVEMLSEFGCSSLEISKFFSCDEATVRKRFKDRIATGREKMKMKLRQLQWKHAELGNTALLIFLGKNYLGQADKSQLDLTGNLEAVLKECGYEDNTKKGFEQGKVLEPDWIRADS